jgi:hypothetical protein
VSSDLTKEAKTQSSINTCKEAESKEIKEVKEHPFSCSPFELFRKGFAEANLTSIDHPMSIS